MLLLTAAGNGSATMIKQKQLVTAATLGEKILTSTHFTTLVHNIMYNASSVTFLEVVYRTNFTRTHLVMLKAVHRKGFPR